MYEFFSAVLDFFELVWNFVQNLINSLIILLQVIAQAITLPPILAGVVPPIISVGILSMFGIAIAKLIVGRDN